MSADNYYIIRRHPKGGFSAVMGFESNDDTPVVREDHLRFDTMRDAEVYASGEYTEYGIQIHPECYESVTALDSTGGSGVELSMTGQQELFTMDEIDSTARYVHHPAWSSFGDHIQKEN